MQQPRTLPERVPTTRKDKARVKEALTKLTNDGPDDSVMQALEAEITSGRGECIVDNWAGIVTLGAVTGRPDRARILKLLADSNTSTLSKWNSNLMKKYQALLTLYDADPKDKQSKAAILEALHGAAPSPGLDLYKALMERMQKETSDKLRSITMFVLRRWLHQDKVPAEALEAVLSTCRKITAYTEGFPPPGGEWMLNAPPKPLLALAANLTFLQHHEKLGDKKASEAEVVDAGVSVLSQAPVLKKRWKAAAPPVDGSEPEPTVDWVLGLREPWMDYQSRKEDVEWAAVVSPYLNRLPEPTMSREVIPKLLATLPDADPANVIVVVAFLLDTLFFGAGIPEGVTAPELTQEQRGVLKGLIAESVEHLWEDVTGKFLTTVLSRRNLPSSLDDLKAYLAVKAPPADTAGRKRYPALPGLWSTPWAVFAVHQKRKATDIPRHLRQLLSRDPVIRTKHMRALYTTPMNMSSRYAVAPWVVHWMVELLKHEAVPNKAHLIEYLSVLCTGMHAADSALSGWSSESIEGAYGLDEGMIPLNRLPDAPPDTDWDGDPKLASITGGAPVSASPGGVRRRSSASSNNSRRSRSSSASAALKSFVAKITGSGSAAELDWQLRDAWYLKSSFRILVGEANLLMDLVKTGGLVPGATPSPETIATATAATVPLGFMDTLAELVANLARQQLGLGSGDGKRRVETSEDVRAGLWLMYSHAAHSISSPVYGGFEKDATAACERASNPPSFDSLAAAVALGRFQMAPKKTGGRRTIPSDQLPSLDDEVVEVLLNAVFGHVTMAAGGSAFSPPTSSQMGNGNTLGALNAQASRNASSIGQFNAESRPFPWGDLAGAADTILSRNDHETIGPLLDRLTALSSTKGPSEFPAPGILRAASIAVKAAFANSRRLSGSLMQMMSSGRATGVEDAAEESYPVHEWSKDQKEAIKATVAIDALWADDNIAHETAQMLKWQASLEKPPVRAHIAAALGVSLDGK